MSEIGVVMVAGVILMIFIYGRIKQIEESEELEAKIKAGASHSPSSWHAKNANKKEAKVLEPKTISNEINNEESLDFIKKDKKSEAIAFINGEIKESKLSKKNTSYSSVNKTVPVYWFNINSNKFNDDINLICESDAEIIWYHIPKGEFEDANNQFYVRKDNNLIHIEIPAKGETNYLNDIKKGVKLEGYSKVFNTRYTAKNFKVNLLIEECTFKYIDDKGDEKEFNAGKLKIQYADGEDCAEEMLELQEEFREKHLIFSYKNSGNNKKNIELYRLTDLPDILEEEEQYNDMGMYGPFKNNETLSFIKDTSTISFKKITQNKSNNDLTFFEKIKSQKKKEKPVGAPPKEAFESEESFKFNSVDLDDHELMKIPWFKNIEPIYRDDGSTNLQMDTLYLDGDSIFLNTPYLEDAYKAVETIISLNGGMSKFKTWNEKAKSSHSFTLDIIEFYECSTYRISLRESVAIFLIVIDKITDATINKVIKKNELPKKRWL